MKKTRKILLSNCCQTHFETKSNGLWDYHVCIKCKDKTIPKKYWKKDVN